MKLTLESVEQACRTMLPGYDPWKHDGAFRFDAAQALRACAFFQEVLTLTTGRWAGQPFDMQPWQVAVVGNVHGWRRIADGTRRYRRVLLTTARKSAKSHVAAGLGLYHLFADGEANPSIVCAAGSAEQASIIYSICAKMVGQEPELSKRSEVMARAIRNLANGGVLRFINSAAGTKHGTNESMVIIDELHVVDDPTLADVLETSTRSRFQPLTLYTTTAGTDPAALWAEVFHYADKVRSGVVEDGEFLPCVWQAAPEDDIRNPATWRKAQPSLGVCVSEDEYRRDLAKALAVPRYLPVFKQLSLNLPTEDHAAWIPYGVWTQCAGVVEPAAGAVCYAGADLASTQDTTAVVLAFPAGDRLLIRPFIFLPQESASGLFHRMKRDKAPYDTWARQGHLILTPGNVIDFDAVADTILAQAKRYDLKEIQMDPHAASSIAAKLQAAGVNVVYVRQGWSLAEACRETERLIQAGKLIHPDNPLLNWQWSNTCVHTDRQENVWPDKKRSTARIDGPVATVMAVNAARFGAGRKDAGDASAVNDYWSKSDAQLLVI